MKKKNVSVIIILVSAIILVWGFWSMGESIIIRYAGRKVVAVVMNVPSECDKYNKIKVLQDGVVYNVSISRSECKRGVYKIGQKVELIKHNKYHELVWPESRPELVVLLILGVLALGYYTNRTKFKKK